MAVELVLTAIARDRPGVVAAVAEVVTANGGNWVDSAMARLGGEFAGIAQISVPEDKVAALEKGLAGLAAQGIDVIVHKDKAGAPPEGRHAKLSLTGLDHPGIVLAVTRTLSGFKVSIDQLYTKVFTASMGGEPMFSAEADMVLPPGLDIEDLRNALEMIAQDIMVDIDLKEVPEN